MKIACSLIFTVNSGNFLRLENALPSKQGPTRLLLTITSILNVSFFLLLCKKAVKSTFYGDVLSVLLSTYPDQWKVRMRTVEEAPAGGRVVMKAKSTSVQNDHAPSWPHSSVVLSRPPLKCPLSLVARWVDRLVNKWMNGLQAILFLSVCLAINTKLCLSVLSLYFKSNEKSNL